MENCHNVLFKIIHCKNNFVPFAFNFRVALMDFTYLAVDKLRKDTGGSGDCVINISSGAGNFLYCFFVLFRAKFCT